MDYVSEALLNAEQALKNSDDKEDIIQHYERYYVEMKYRSVFLITKKF